MVCNKIAIIQATFDLITLCKLLFSLERFYLSKIKTEFKNICQELILCVFPYGFKGTDKTRTNYVGISRPLRILTKKIQHTLEITNRNVFF